MIKKANILSGKGLDFMPIKSVFVPADIFLPFRADMPKWSVIACDQFSSEPEYWDRVKTCVGSEPSTLNMMLPECWLEGADMEDTAQSINDSMVRYLHDGTLTEVKNSYIFTRRTLSSGDGVVRMGIIGALDLETYDYLPSAHALVRASENTVIDRLPPRIYAREHAELEMPHIIALIDDPDRTVIEPIAKETGQMECRYDFDLMEGGGHITGYRVTEELAGRIAEGLAKLSNPKTAAGKYDAETEPMLMIVGDGNHSLAAAKTCWDKIKPSLTETERENHPARFALVEVNNIHDKSLEIEPIHRAVFTHDTQKLLEEFIALPDNRCAEPAETYKIGYTTKDTSGEINITASNIGEVIGLIEGCIDGYTSKNGGRVDYIHGSEALKKLSAEQGVIGFFMPAIRKSDLFRSVAQGGIFPKKSFSMGHAKDKRYYLELRRIR